MCQSCYENNYGAPTIYNKNVAKAVELIGGVYEHHSAGGGLHIVIDDWNLDCIGGTRHYLESKAYRADSDVTKERLKAEMKCITQLEKMTEEEVASALGLYDKFLELEDME